MTQNAFTSLVPVKRGEKEALAALLNEIGGDIKGNPHIRFGEFSAIHFARWVIVPGEKETDATRLAFGTDHDGPTDALLTEMVRRAGPALAEIYGHCEDCPPDVATNAPAFVRYLRAHAVPYAGRHIAYWGHKVTDVRNDLAVRERLETLLDREDVRRDLAGCGPEQIHAKLRQLLRASDPDLRTAPTPRQADRRLAAIGLGAAAAVGITAWRAPRALLILVALLAAFAATLRMKETADARELERNPPPLDAPDVTDLARRENYQVQNQMTHIVPVKPGPFRRWTLKAVLGAVNLLAATYWNKGELGSIPTIHFARWMLIDNDRRLLFFSNFDGSWENYLGDFVDKASVGLTGVWSNTVGFPAARWLVLGGATDAERFKTWTRRHQVPTQVWYSAHPDHTVTNILNAVAVRDGVEQPLDAPAAARWLRRL